MSLRRCRYEAAVPVRPKQQRDRELFREWLRGRGPWSERRRVLGVADSDLLLARKPKRLRLLEKRSGLQS